MVSSGKVEHGRKDIPDDVEDAAEIVEGLLNGCRDNQ